MADEILTVDLSKLAASLLAELPSGQDRARLVGSLGTAALAFWKREALQQLKSSSRDYAAGLTLDVTADKATVTLSGTLPNLVENGFRGGDMRQWMLSGPKAKVGKRGRYLVIPFQHGTPSSGGRNVGTPMPLSIYNAAKKLSPTLSRPQSAVSSSGGRTSIYGQRLNPRSAGVNTEARNILTSKAKPWHASSVYTGMIRSQKTYKAATQTSGYKTFRTISENTIRGAQDAQGGALEHWFHPGIPPRKLAGKTRDFVVRIAGSMLAGSQGDRKGTP